MDDRSRTRAPSGTVFAGIAADPTGDCASPEPDDAVIARAVRTRYAEVGLRCLRPDAAVVGLLAAGECLVAASPGVVSHTRDEPAEGSGHRREPGDLYVTNRRLLLAGPGDSPGYASVELDDVVDAAIAPGRLLLILVGGGAMAVETPRPRLLRAQIAIARAERAAAVRLAPETSGPPRAGSSR